MSCFGAATFVVVLQFSQNNGFIELACNRSAFWQRDLNSWTLISEKIAYKTFFTVRIRLAILWRLAFLVAYIRLATFALVQNNTPVTILSKAILLYFWYVMRSFFAIVTRFFFCSSVNKWSIHLAFIFLTFKCFLKFVIQANCLTVNRASILRIFRIFFYVTFGRSCCRTTLASSIFQLLLPSTTFSYPLTDSPVRHLALPINVTHLAVNIYSLYAE